MNAAGTVAAPAAIAPGRGEPRREALGHGRDVSRRVTQAGQARGGATVTIFGGAKATGLKRLGKRDRSRANGAFTFKAKTGTFFRADAVAAPGAAAPLCARSCSRCSAPIPCVNPTVNGFAAQEQGREEEVAGHVRRGRAAARPLTLPRDACDRPTRHVQLRGRGARQDLVPARRLDVEGPARLLRRAVRHRRGRLALLPPPRSGRDGPLGAANAAGVHVPRQGARLDDGARAGGAGAGVRRVPRLARAARALGEAPRDPPPVPPPLQEVARGEGRARARAPGSSSRSSRSSSSGTARGSRRTSARTPSRSSSGTGSRTCRSTPRGRGRRTSSRPSRPRRTRSRTSASTVATRRPGTSAPRSRPTASTGCTRRRSSPSGSTISVAWRTRPTRSTRSSTTTATTSRREARCILRGLLDEAGIPASGGVEPPPVAPTLF